MKSEDSGLWNGSTIGLKSTGNHALKSSVLSPVGGKLTNQFKIANDLIVHYGKLVNAKPSIDSSAPKVWLARKRARERRQRTGSSTSRTYRSQTTEFDNDDDYSSRPLTATAAAIERGEFATWKQSYQSQSSDNNVPSETLNKALSVKMRTELEHYAKTGVDVPKYDNNDLIVRHQEAFVKKEKPFTPRTLNRSNTQSRLSSMPCYTRPRRSKSRADSAQVDEQNGFSADVRQASVSDGSTTRPRAGAGFSDTQASDTLLRSHDGRFNNPPQPGVPPLNISLDADHFRWLQEQQTMQQKDKRAKFLASRKDQSSFATSQQSLQTTVDQGALKTTPPPGIPPQNSLASVKKRIGEDESRKYQDFLAEVTRDILDRGIYTNRGLRQVFQSHVEKRGDLKLSKMKEMLAELEQKLGLPPDGHELSLDGDFGYGSTLRSALSKSNPDDSEQPRRAGFRADGDVEFSRPPRPRQPPTRSRQDSVETGSSENGAAGVQVQDRSPRSPTGQARKTPSPQLQRLKQKSPPLAIPASPKSDDDDSYGYDMVDAGATRRLSDNFRDPNATLDTKNKSRSKPRQQNGATVRPAATGARAATNGRLAGSHVKSSTNSRSSASPQPKNKSRSGLSKQVAVDDENDVGERNRERKGQAKTSDSEERVHHVTTTVGPIDDDVERETELAANKFAVTSLYSGDQHGGASGGADVKDNRYDDDDDDLGVRDSDGNDEEGYQTNDELLDTMTIYQQHLEKTNFHDEGGRDSDEEDAVSAYDDDFDRSELSSTAKPVNSAKGQPPVPSPRKRGN